MDLNRLGAGFATRLSFMRVLVRQMINEQWHISYSRFNLDEQGYGHAVFSIRTPNQQFSFVVFSQYLDPQDRNDRVIAEKWDLTMTLVAGGVDDDMLQQLEKNVPLQEAGRIEARCIALSRANRSARLFGSVLADLRQGNQPDVNMLTDVGYLYRTTAVYGSGKFGAGDWEQVNAHYSDLSRPFAGEMLVCYLIRQFSLDQLHHLVHQPQYPNAVDLDDQLQRYLGIGNSTGLGMAPWLVNHPMVMNQWVLQRETALARALLMPVSAIKLVQLRNLMQRACQHVRETSTFDPWQQSNNQTLLTEMQALQDWFDEVNNELDQWSRIMAWGETHYSVETQELLVSLLIELFPEQVDDLADHMVVQENLQYDPTAMAETLIQAIENTYAWVFDYDFSEQQQDATFWYYSRNKIEPRLGKVASDPGAELQMFMGIAKEVQVCYYDLQKHMDSLQKRPLETPLGQNTPTQNALDATTSIAEFLYYYPQHQGIVPRIYTMAHTAYGEIRANLLHQDVLPMHLLRAKLANFGVGKFDPKSALWVRNTMYQGAPRVSDLGKPIAEDWSFPTAAVYDSGMQNQQNAEAVYG